jgi:uncharacterized repeat protein (TIGR01451 family)
MKKLSVVAAILVALSAAAADAAVITNTCTSTYVAINQSVEIASGWDTVAISTETTPYISVVKYVKNLRTGVESSNVVTGIAGDAVEFRIVWSNQGGPADTVTITDYIPSGLTYAGSLSDTEANCDTPGTAVWVAGENRVLYITNSVNGITPGPSGDGVIRFRATID